MTRLNHGYIDRAFRLRFRPLELDNLVVITPYFIYILGAAYCSTGIVLFAFYLARNRLIKFVDLSDLVSLTPLVRRTNIQFFIYFLVSLENSKDSTPIVPSSIYLSQRSILKSRFCPPLENAANHRVYLYILIN